MDDVLQKFQEAMISNGIKPPASIIADGKIHRFNTGNSKKRNKNGWYCFYPDDPAAGAFGDWKTGDKHTWSARNPRLMSEAERLKHQQHMEAIKQARQAEQERIYAKAASRALGIWNSSERCYQHPYLGLKQITAFGGVRQDRYGNLLVPVQNMRDELTSLQMIDHQGAKKFLTGGRISGCFLPISGCGDTPTVFCEGYATAVSIYKAIDYSNINVIACFNAGNLSKVLAKFRKKHPDTPFYIAADDDRWTSSNPGIKKATEAAKKYGATVITPQFPPGSLSKQPSDFNDLHCLTESEHGFSYAVRKQIMGGIEEADMARAIEVELISRETLTESPPPPEFIISYYDSGLIEKGVVGALAATGGTGKSFYFIQLGMALASGGSFGPLQCGQMQTLFINAEDSGDTLKRRIWSVSGGNLPVGFSAVSLSGRGAGPLMELQGGNPQNGPGFVWLDKFLEAHPEFEVLLLDPLSRFYGLDELNSSHGTAFVDALEQLSKKHELTILISHHTNEASQKESGRMSKTMLRGNSALSDGLRWCAGMRKMTDVDAQKYGIQAARQFVEYDVIKNNGGLELPHPIFFKQDQQTGAFHHVDPSKGRIGSMAEFLADELASINKPLSRRDIVKGNAAKAITKAMADEFGFKKTKEADRVIDLAIERGFLVEQTIQTGSKKQSKEVLVPAEPKPEKNGLKPEAGSRKRFRLSEGSDFNGNENKALKPETNEAGKKQFPTFKANENSELKAGKSDPLKGGGREVSGFPAIPPGFR